MKKFISMILVLAMALCLFAGCGNAKEDGVLKIAVVRQLDHSSMEEIQNAITGRLDAIAKEKNLKITYKDFSGGNDATVLAQVGTQIKDDRYDAVIPIGTLAAQSMVTALEGTNTPVIYAAVSDPQKAGLVDLPKVTGVSDALNTEFIMDMILALDPEIKAVGLLYSNSEPNSATPVAQAKAYLEKKGITVIEKTGNNASEILAAAESLVDRVEAVFTPTDNVVMASEGAVAEILNKAGIPHYTGADSFVTSGAFVTSGVNYTELGAKAADMAIDALQNGNYPAFHVMAGGIITVNKETATALNINYSVFNTMAGTVKEVETGK